MIQKEKYNAKKILALILSLACVTGLLAGCARQNTSEGKADGSSLEEQTSDTWYEVDQEAGILTVRLPAEKEGFIWDFTIDDTTLLELLTEEDDDGTFVASFRALGDGETVVSFPYARDDALEEIRALNVTCKDGKVADVSNASEEPSSGTWYEVDQEAGILTVRLPAEKEGFIWDFTIDDTTLLELLTEEDDDGTFVASFRALGDGETVVSFSYARDDALEEIRTLNVTCKDGKVADVCFIS